MDLRHMAYIACLSVYLMLGFMSWLTLTCFLRDEKKELNGSWTVSALLGAVLAFAWPISMVMLYLYRRSGEK